MREKMEPKSAQLAFDLAGGWGLRPLPFRSEEPRVRLRWVSEPPLDLDGYELRAWREDPVGYALGRPYSPGPGETGRVVREE